MNCPECRSAEISTITYPTEDRVEYLCRSCRNKWSPKVGTQVQTKHLSFQEVVEKRGIRELLHFTRLGNLESIAQKGLLPRDELERLGIPEADFNDLTRVDDLKQASCLSISFPNYQMFYSCRRRTPAQAWVVLSIKPSVLWKMRCIFCVENAASSLVRNTPVDSRMGPAALDALFGDHPKRKRLDLGLPRSFPTSPQAEVLVEGAIGIEFLQHVYLEKDTVGLRLPQFGPGIGVSARPEFFRYRMDYEHWKKKPVEPLSPDDLPF